MVAAAATTEAQLAESLLDKARDHGGHFGLFNGENAF
jgi:hypothetical protein